MNLSASCLCADCVMQLFSWYDPFGRFWVKPTGANLKVRFEAPRKPALTLGKDREIQLGPISFGRGDSDNLKGTRLRNLNTRRLPNLAGTCRLRVSNRTLSVCEAKFLSGPQSRQMQTCLRTCLEVLNNGRL